jgi:hypothetical protein
VRTFENVLTVNYCTPAAISDLLFAGLGVSLFMAIINPSASPPDSLGDHLFAPALALLPGCPHLRRCPELPDSRWMQIGVSRCLLPLASGRGFLQWFSSLAPDLCPDHSHFFATLHSSRRLALVDALNARLCQHSRASLPDALKVFPCLDGFDVYAGDGHFHAHATHDPPDSQGRKHAVGHLFIRDMRCGLLRHLCVADQAERKKEHDMRALKRLTLATLRQGAKKGRKVLYVWDRAGIDFKQWYDWKQGSGIYMLSRCKENMALIKCGDLPFDAGDAINAGVLKDELAGPSGSGEVMRRITYRDAVSGNTYEYLTNLIDSKVPPGVLAWLYKTRWDIEKSFDEIKNKLGEQKAWGSSATAKSMQAQFICLTLNLLHLLEHEIKEKEGIVNAAEDKRREKRLGLVREGLKKAGAVLPKALELVQRSTQHSVKFIRWVAARLWRNNPWKLACVALAALYARL